MRNSFRNARGYVLLETVMALVVLSIGSLAVNGALRNALQTRGQAMDYTEARFILDELMAQVELQPKLNEGGTAGVWTDNPRFGWNITIRKSFLSLPNAARRPGRKAKDAGAFEFDEDNDYMTSVRISLFWTRSGQPFEESYETLLLPDRLKKPELVRPR